MDSSAGSLPDDDHTMMQGTFFFDPKDRIYADHFPGHPVVPGSMIVCAFMLAGERLGFGEAPSSIRNFRFKRFIPPGEYSYRIELAGDQLQCTLYDRGAIVVTGTLMRCRPFSQTRDLAECTENQVAAECTESQDLRRELIISNMSF